MTDNVRDRAVHRGRCPHGGRRPGPDGGGLLPLMFFSGLYYGFVPAAPLLVLAAYAAGFGYPAMRFFRWE
jgi:hypothetical protein